MVDLKVLLDTLKVYERDKDGSGSEPGVVNEVRKDLHRGCRLELGNSLVHDAVNEVCHHKSNRVDEVVCGGARMRLALGPQMQNETRLTYDAIG